MTVVCGIMGTCVGASDTWSQKYPNFLKIGADDIEEAHIIIVIIRSVASEIARHVANIEQIGFCLGTWPAPHAAAVDRGMVPNLLGCYLRESVEVVVRCEKEKCEAHRPHLSSTQSFRRKHVNLIKAGRCIRDTVSI